MWTFVSMWFVCVCARKKNLNTLIPNYDDCDNCGCKADRSDWTGRREVANLRNRKEKKTTFARKWIRGREKKNDSEIWMMKCWMHNNNRVTNRRKRMKSPIEHRHHYQQQQQHEQQRQALEPKSRNWCGRKLHLKVIGSANEYPIDITGAIRTKCPWEKMENAQY